MIHSEPTMKRAGGPMSAEDRLSALPDGLLHAILSFLPAPQAVQTSLLSRRWRRLWRSAPLIEIDSHDFGISGTISRDTVDERWARFENFATNLLLFHDNTSSLGAFHLRSRLHNWCHVDRWVRRGIEYCPSVLKIQILDLDHDLSFKLPNVVGSSFCRLKRLRLCRVILDGHFIAALCSACPVLEDMDLQLCKFCGILPEGIISPTLNKYGCYPSGLSLCKMDSLVEAEIYIEQYETLPQKTQHELLGSLFNVRSLELVGFEAEDMLIENSDKFPTFDNMRTLDLYNCFRNEYELNDKLEALRSLIENAPCLEKLILQYCMFYSFSDSEWEPGRKNITLHHQDRNIFQCQKLKLVEVIYDYDHDHQLIELLWSLGRSLPDASIKLSKIELYP
ncbi:hypothetical protein BS78_02G107100 [Paspalum vaginatum]|nr:hypothetical protein BS78_02G107100 [Paspalum vaginatum]